MDVTRINKMSKVIPSQFMMSNSPIGVDTFKDVTVERVRVMPIGTTSSTAYTPTGLNKKLSGYLVILTLCFVTSKDVMRNILFFYGCNASHRNMKRATS